MTSDLKQGAAESGVKKSDGNRYGIFLRTFIFISLFSMAIVGLYSSITIIRGRDALIMSLASEARSVTASISQVCGNAVVNEDYEFIVEHSLEVLNNSKGILYIVVVRKNGFTLVHTLKKWELFDKPAPEWRSGKAVVEGGQIMYSSLIGQNVYRFSYPLQYSGLQWGFLHIGLSLEHLQNETDYMYKITALLAFFCILGTMLGSYFFARNLTLPVLSLLRATSRITQGDLSTRAKITTKDEIGNLALSFNKMTEKLEKTTVSKDYVNNIIQSMNESLIVMNVKGRVEMINQAAMDLLNVTFDELIQKSFMDFLNEESLTQEKDWIKEITQKGFVRNVEKNLYLREGRTIPILMSGSVMRDDKGAIQGFICLLMDNTQRKQAEFSLKEAYEELKKTQVQLIQSGKLASIGELAAGVAHELNQPLMVIRGNAQLVQRSIQKGKGNVDDLAKLLEPVNRNTKRMMNIINHLRTFSRQTQTEYRGIDVNKIIEDSFLMLGEQLRLRNVEISKELGVGLPKIKGDANQLEQVILNLIANARDAVETRDEGRQTKDDSVQGRDEYIKLIEIITKKGEFPNQQTTIDAPQSENFVEILVKDNGGGIPVDKVNKIFDPFFTTKEVGKGTGLGLSISYGIIKDHKGEIKIEETGAKGTTFRIRLPIAD